MVNAQIPGMLLSDLLADFVDAGSLPPVEIFNIASNSNQITPGSVAVNSGST